jgi:hypothetical protein
MEIEEVMGKIEQFFVQAAKVAALETSDEDLDPASDDEIARVEKKHGFQAPDELRRFWRRGFKQVELSTSDKGDGFATAGFDWLTLELLDRDLPMFRGLAQHYPEGDPEKRLLQVGIPLTYSPPQVVWDPDGGIVHYSTRNPLLPPITPTLSAFLEHWLEAGCFGSHALSAYLPLVEGLVPGRIPQSENRWIAHYRKQFGPKV